MRPDAAALLWDVHDAARKVGQFIVGLDERGYASDDLRKSAVERQFEIIGEALNKLRVADPETALGPAAAGLLSAIAACACLHLSAYV
jgi:uncharacterized protein with HEPN domain